jgi:HK97 family phage prohead protease
MSKLARRFIPAENLELRAEQEGEERKITGYGIVYNRETLLWDDLYEVIRPGAATEVLAQNPDIKCALNHDRRYLFGRTKSGTMTVEEDERGVKYTAIPPDAQWAKDAMASIARGDIDGSSFTFAVLPQDEKVTKRKDGTFLREIFKFSRIGEMGPVTEPAYEDTTAEVNAFRSAQEEYESLTSALRAQGTEEGNKTADYQRALELRRRKLDLHEKALGGETNV